MFKKIVLSILTILVLAGSVVAQKPKIQGYAERGGLLVKVSPTQTYKVQASYPNSVVTVYLTGTLTLATIYSDTSGTPKANPFNADSTGFYSFFIDGGIVVDIKFSGGDIVVPFTTSNVGSSGGTSFGRDISEFSDSLATAISQIGGTNETLIISSPITIPASATIPATLELYFVRTGTFSVNAGQTVTIKGAVNAPNRQIFYGSGSVSFTDNLVQDIVRAEWWGAIPQAYNATLNDITTNLQAALTAVGTRSFSKVKVGNGHLKIATNGGVSIPTNVTLECGKSTPSSLTNFTLTTLDTYPGTIFHITADEGNAAVAHARTDGSDAAYAVTVNGPGALVGCGFYYPNQSLGTAVSTPTIYPFTIGMRGQNPTVEDVLLVNSYQGIDAGYSDRPTVQRILGQVLKYGLWIDKVRDIPRLRDIHWNPFWSNGHPTNIFRWCLDNQVAFVIGKVDWVDAHGLFTFGGLAGFRFIQSANDGVWNGGGAAGVFSNIQVDAYLIGILAGGTFGVSGTPSVKFSNSYFMPLHEYEGYIRVGNGDTDFQDFTGAWTSTGIRTQSTYSTASVMSFSSCEIGGGAATAHYIMELRGSGTINLSSCILRGWDYGNTGRYGVYTRGPHVSISSSTFAEIENDVSIDQSGGASIVGNLFRSSIQFDFSGSTWGGCPSASPCSAHYQQANNIIY